MKSILNLIIYILFVFSISSCYKGNLIIDETEKPTPTETSSNPLVERGGVSENGFDIGCVTVLFPFHLSVNGEEINIENEDDIYTILEDSSDFTAYIDFVYPINFNGKDGIKKVSNGEELGNLFANCIPELGWEQGFPAFLLSKENSCFELK
jgi:hypothetical protein